MSKYGKLYVIYAFQDYEYAINELGYGFDLNGFNLAYSTWENGKIKKSQLSRMEKCVAVIYVHSKYSGESPDVIAQLEHAVSLDKKMAVFRIDDTPLPQNIEAIIEPIGNITAWGDVKTVRDVISTGYRRVRYMIGANPVDEGVNESNKALNEIIATVEKLNKEGNWAECFKYAQQGYKMGSAYCGGYLAYMYYYGKGMEENAWKAYAIYDTLAKIGFPTGLRNIAFGYGSGCYGFPRSIRKSINYFKRAIALGHTISMVDLAWVYTNGEIEPKPQEAYRLLHKAALLEEKFAYVPLGKLCKRMRQYTEAYQWFKKGVENDCEEAKQCLDELLKFHPQVELLCKPMSQITAGDAYKLSCMAMERGNFAEQMKWAEKAAELGEFNPLQNLIVGYMPKIYRADAFALCKRVADSEGNPEPLARCYLWGIGVKEDFAETVRLLEKAVEWGDNDRAPSTLVSIYKYGRKPTLIQRLFGKYDSRTFIKPDIEKARYWAQFAIAHNSDKRYIKEIEWMMKR